MSAIPKSWKFSRRDGSSSLYSLIGDFVSQEIAFVGLIKVTFAKHHGLSRTEWPPCESAGASQGCLCFRVFLIFLTAYRDRNHVEAATSSKLTIGTGDQDDAIALALASNMTGTDLDVSEIAVPRHRCQLVHSHTLKIHCWITSLRSIGSEARVSHEIR
jgi:hypothetical protein